MKPATTVVSMPVTDLERTPRFYRDGLGLETAGIDGPMILIAIPLQAKQPPNRFPPSVTISRQ